MPSPRIRLRGADIDFATIRAELNIAPEYPAAAVAEAAAMTSPDLSARDDDRDVEFVTIDPPGSMDLDQAIHLEARDGGFRIRYAIVDVSAFVTLGSALEAESWRRGMTYYSPDLRTPLYPTVLSEGAASLLPGVDRPAVLWTMDLDAAGEPVDVTVRRTVVRSREQFDYPTVQAAADVGRLHPSIALLPTVGMLRLQAARRRHAIDLDLPDTEVVPTKGGRWTLLRRSILPVEHYNAQISLLTGMCAATMMVRGGVGILRTLPPPTDDAIRQLRHVTETFDIPWPEGVPPGDIVSGLDSGRPKEAAFIEDAVRLLRGAGYTVLRPGEPQVPNDRLVHAGVAAPYAHVTAPLRRLVDRYATEVCLALSEGRAVPDWVSGRLAELPSVMNSSGQLASRLDRECAQAVSEFLLAEQVGAVLTGIVVQLDPAKGKATVLLDEPPVRVKAPADGFTEASRAAVRVTAVDSTSHRVEVEIVR